MKVHFIRHAHAIERSTLLSDEHRNLTCRGRKRFRLVASCLRKIDIDPDLIMVSPKVRAVQTAEILSEALRFNGEVQIHLDLEYGPDLTTLANLMKANPEAREIVIIGHEPSLGEVIGKLLHLSQPCHITKGSVVSMKISLGQFGLIAELSALITAGGKKIRNSGTAAIDRLLGKNTNRNKEVAI